MKLITLSGWSLAVSALALLVAVGVAGYTRNQYNLTSEQAQRVLAVKKPVLDIASQPIDGRHWNLSVMITNPSQDVREGGAAFREKRTPKFEGR